MALILMKILIILWISSMNLVRCVSRHEQPTGSDHWTVSVILSGYNDRMTASLMASAAPPGLPFITHSPYFKAPGLRWKLNQALRLSHSIHISPLMLYPCHVHIWPPDFNP